MLVLLLLLTHNLAAHTACAAWAPAAQTVYITSAFDAAVFMHMGRTGARPHTQEVGPDIACLIVQAEYGLDRVPDRLLFGPVKAHDVPAAHRTQQLTGDAVGTDQALLLLIRCANTNHDHVCGVILVGKQLNNLLIVS